MLNIPRGGDWKGYQGTALTLLGTIITSERLGMYDVTTEDR